MEYVEAFIEDVINQYLWNIVAAALLFAGLYFCLRTVVVQIRMIPDMLRAVAESPGDKDPKAQEKEEGLSAFKAFTISAASRVGTGNIAGVALAITVGGPGAVFWMWIIALVGGATAFIESTLAQLWKTKDNGTYHGGPAYYMTRGLGGWGKGLSIVFSVLITVTYGFVYNAIQTNSIVEATTVSFGSASTQSKVIIGVVLAALTGVVVFGGVRRIASVTQVVVPFMAVAYLLVGLYVVIINIGEIPGVIGLIVGHALGIREVAGASFGAALIFGLRRGLFSNEAGQGSAPNAAATATVSHPVKQGLVQTLGVYFDTLVVCSITAFIILLSNPSFGEDVETASLTQHALSGEVGSWGTHFITFILFFLAFSSVLGNYYLAQANVEYFSESRTVMVMFRLLVILCVFGGAIGSVPLVWSLGDTFAGLMVCVNLIAIVPLGGVAIKLLRNYSGQRIRGKDPVFHRDMLPDVPNVECWDGTDAASAEATKRLAEIRQNT